MNHKRFLALAKKISKKSDHGQHKMGCVIVRGGQVLGEGFNLLKTHPKSPHSFKQIHAEFMAAMNASYDIEGATVYIFRQQRNGTWSIAKPCPSCWNFLKKCGIKRVVYSFEGAFVQEELPNGTKY